MCSFFDEFKKLFSTKSNPVVRDLVCGSLANTVGAVLNTPLDVVKTRIQKVGGNESRRSMLSIFRSLLRDEGVRGLWRGLGARI